MRICSCQGRYRLRTPGYDAEPALAAPPAGPVRAWKGRAQHTPGIPYRLPWDSPSPALTIVISPTRQNRPRARLCPLPGCEVYHSRDTRSPVNSPVPSSASLPPRPKVRAESARALCRACGGPLVGPQRVACSARCRAGVSREQKAEVRRERDAEIRALLEAALEKLSESDL